MFKKNESFVGRIFARGASLYAGLCIAAFIHNPFGVAFASTASTIISGATTDGSTSGKLSSVTWPWTKFLTSLADQLTGPLPMTLGILGLAFSMFSLFTGNGGPATQKALTIVFAVSAALFAPTFISYISTSASGMLIPLAMGM